MVELSALVAAVLIAIVWIFSDALLHGKVLAIVYREEPGLWRPVEQMSASLISVVSLILVAFFIVTYVFLVSPKSPESGMIFGALSGIALGVFAGFGAYIYSPIPLSLAWGWFASGCFKGFIAGLIVGLVIR